MSDAATATPSTPDVPRPQRQAVGVASVATPRNAALDVVRGVAICGIIFVNIAPLTAFQRLSGHHPTSLDNPSGWLQLLVHQRFFPIFSLLFGIGFTLTRDTARLRSTRPRLVLGRRLLLLLVFGAGFQLVQPGAALLPYALVGLTILLPSTWLPRHITAAAAIVLCVAALLLVGGGIALVPGMVLLGSALTRYRLTHALGQSRRGSIVALASFVIAAVPAVQWQLSDIPGSGFTVASAVAGLLLAGVYGSGLSALMTTRAANSLVRVFAPLGRLALTNYVGAAPLMLAAGFVLDFPHATSWTLPLLTAAAILILQWVLSTVWIRQFTHGPLEWLWRWGTWGRRHSLRRDPTPTGVAPALGG